MPFGIQTKGFIVGILFALFVYPWIMSLFSNFTRAGD